MIHRVNHLLQSHHRFRFLISRTAKRFEETDSDTLGPRLVISVAESELLALYEWPSRSPLAMRWHGPVQAIQTDDSICDAWPPPTHHLSTLVSSPSERMFTSSIHYL